MHVKHFGQARFAHLGKRKRLSRNSDNATSLTPRERA
jgi:hypothetical protein